MQRQGYNQMIEDLINYLELRSEDREKWNKFNFENAPRLKELLKLLEED